MCVYIYICVCVCIYIYTYMYIYVFFFVYLNSMEMGNLFGALVWSHQNDAYLIVRTQTILE